MKNLIFILFIFSFIGQASEYNDPFFADQWGLINNGQELLIDSSSLEQEMKVGIPGADVGFVDTSSLHTPVNEVIVAVIDSGVDINHPELKNKIWFNEKLCKNAPNAKNLPCYGQNFLDNNNDIQDDKGHGTHVAGIIAAEANNHLGIVGAGDSRLKIMPLKVVNKQLSGFAYNGKLISEAVADALMFAVKNGAKVVNLSLGWPKIIDTLKVRQAFQYAFDQNVVIVAAAGNNGKDIPTFPCAYDKVVCVGAIDNQNMLPHFSNFGSRVDVSAPGQSIISLYPQKMESSVLRINNFEVLSGTSQAAPFVTATLATFRLLHPELNVNEVLALFYQSTIPMDGIFWGKISQKNLYNISLDKLQSERVFPLVKNIIEVPYNYSSKSFVLEMPFRNLSAASFSGKVCLSMPAFVSLANNCQDVKDVQAYRDFSLTFSGTILDTIQDSHISLEVKVGDKVYPTFLVFSRNLNLDPQIETKVITGVAFEDMAYLTSAQKISKLSRVSDLNTNSIAPDYFFLEKAKQNDNTTALTFLTGLREGFVIRTIAIPKVAQILSVFKKDINGDGHLDYVVYSLSMKKDKLIFNFFDENLVPLFGDKSQWSFDLTTFEGLPTDATIEKFDWLRVKTTFAGTVLVPSINKEYSMPEIDNSTQLLDRVVGTQNHQYYLWPTLINNQVVIQLRALDSVDFMNHLKMRLGLDDSFRLSVMRSIPQTSKDIQEGLVKLLVKATDNEINFYYEIKTNGQEIGLVKIESELSIDEALIYPVWDLEAKENSSDHIFTSLLQRNESIFAYQDQKKNKNTLAPTLKNNWDNPIMLMISASKGKDGRSYFFENRFSVSYFNEAKQKRSDLLVYRDSSFPGQNFSEILFPVQVDDRPGLFVNSTFIFGSRLYVMTPIEDILSRPISLSVSIPDGCVPLRPEKFNRSDAFSFLFLCKNQASGEVSVKMLPMSLNQ